MGLYEYILREGIKTPIKLEIGLDKVVYDKKRNGNDTRYFTVKIDRKNVTQMVAEAVGLKVSKAKGTYGSLIIHGSNMDMGFALQDRMYHQACIAGYPDMFDMNDYKYLGARIRCKRRQNL